MAATPISPGKCICTNCIRENLPTRKYRSLSDRRLRPHHYFRSHPVVLAFTPTSTLTVNFTTVFIKHPSWVLFWQMFLRAHPRWSVSVSFCARFCAYFVQIVCAFSLAVLMCAFVSPSIQQLVQRGRDRLCAGMKIRLNITHLTLSTMQMNSILQFTAFVYEYNVNGNMTNSSQLTNSSGLTTTTTYCYGYAPECSLFLHLASRSSLDKYLVHWNIVATRYFQTRLIIVVIYSWPHAYTSLVSELQYDDDLLIVTSGLTTATYGNALECSLFLHLVSRWRVLHAHSHPCLTLLPPNSLNVNVTKLDPKNRTA